MTHPRITQGAAALAAIALGTFLWSACSDNISDFPLGPSAATLGQAPDIHAAIAAQGHHTDALMRIPGVVGTAVALVKGKAAVRIFVERADVRGLPSQLDGMPVDVKVTGRFIALSDPTTLGNATPTDDGYGTPSGAIYGDGNNDGVFDDVSTLLGLNVQKYGRTTKLTHGQITGVNATVDVCYEVFFIICIKSARFVDQLVIEPGSFSGGGD